SANQLRHFLGLLKGGRLVDHATLGATVATSGDGRVVVSDILESSDAWKRGLRYDDEIVSLAGRPVRTVNAFKNVLGTLPAGWQVPLMVRREGRPQRMLVRLAGIHSAAKLADLVAGGLEPGPDEGRKAVEKFRLPEVVADLYEPRPGYANHRFNVIERDRVGAALAAHRDTLPPGPWVLAGRLEGGEEFRIELADSLASIDLPTGSSSLAVDEPFDRNPAPPGSGGLLAALVVWRRLVTEGPARLGRTAYWGTAPRDPAALGDAAAVDLADVLETSVAGVEARCTVDADGRVLAVDLWTSPDAEPCEVRFAWDAEAGGPAALPTRIDVARGGQAFGRFVVERPAAGEAAR
ncbi:MAG: PDZ domain-containing protein, partial [Pirellulales bacterium]